MSNKHQTTPSNVSVTVDVTEEEFAADLARGLVEDEVLQPGRHTFRRGAFLERHGLTPEEKSQTPTKVYLSVPLDQDVVDFVQAQAEEQLAEQINTMLREVMNRKMSNGEDSAPKTLATKASSSVNTVVS